MAQKAEIDVAPGFYWEYEPGLGYAGRKAVNPLTGEVFSEYQIRAIRAGKKTLEQARETVYGIVATSEETTTHFIYSITVFSRLDGAIDWAAQLPNPSYIAVLGIPRTKYKTDQVLNAQGQRVYDITTKDGRVIKGHGGEPTNLAWRNLTGIQDPSAFTGKPHGPRITTYNRQDIFDRQLELLDPKYIQFARYFVYEQIER